MTPQRDGQHEVIVIGAGQSGLAAGHHLARRGLDFVILEADRRVGDVWRRRYDSLKLYSPAKLDDLPGLPFPLPGNTFPTGPQMADYLEAYVAHHRLPVQTDQRVDHVARASGGDGFELTAGSAHYRAQQVIVATGPFQRPFVPDFAARLDPAIRQLHSADYRNPNQLADGPVLVVGVSHSGADIAYEVAAAGYSTSLSGIDRGQLPFSVDSRRMRVLWPLMRFLATRVLTLGTPIGRKVGPKVRAHGGPLLRVRRADLERAGVRRYLARATGAQDGCPVLADGTVLDVANVIWCTGYRPDFSWIELPITGDDGWPHHTRGVATSDPGCTSWGCPSSTRSPRCWWSARRATPSTLWAASPHAAPVRRHPPRHCHHRPDRHAGHSDAWMILNGHERRVGQTTEIKRALRGRPAKLHNCAGYARSPTLGSTARDRICMSSMCSYHPGRRGGLRAGRRRE